MLNRLDEEGSQEPRMVIERTREVQMASGAAKRSSGIYDGILGSIVSGEFAENARLPSEVELARRFGASRPVVREALARLRDDGLIVSRQGSGSYVRRRPDNAVLQFVPVGSIADIQRCFEFRVGLEGAAVARATHNHYHVSVQLSLQTHIAFGMNLTRNLSLRRPEARLRLVQDEHARILAAIEARDGAAARRAVE